MRLKGLLVDYLNLALLWLLYKGPPNLLLSVLLHVILHQEFPHLQSPMRLARRMHNPVPFVQLSLLFSPGIWLPTPFSSCQCPHPFRNLISLVSSRIPLSSFRRVTISMSLNKFLTIIFFCLKFFLLNSLRFVEFVLSIHMQYFMPSTCSTKFGFNMCKCSKYSHIMIIWM